MLLPRGATLFVASSMPVRDIETFWPVRPDPPRVLCNRGANGIDGTVSSAFGAAADGSGPVVLLIGDVALAHDIGGLLAARRLELKLTIVLLDNGGGGIFDFLPVSRARMARAEDIYTRHIATPTGTRLHSAGCADSYGFPTSGTDVPGVPDRTGAGARGREGLSIARSAICTAQRAERQAARATCGAVARCSARQQRQQRRQLDLGLGQLGRGSESRTMPLPA